MKHALLLGTAMLLGTAVTEAYGDAGVGAARNRVEEETFAIDQMEESRAEFVKEKLFLSRILEAVQDRLKELQSRDTKAADLQQNAEDKLLGGMEDALKGIPDAFRDSVVGKIFGESLKKALHLVKDFGEAVNAANDAMDAGWAAVDPVRAQTMEKVSKELADFTNEIAICDAFIAGIDNKISAAKAARDSANRELEQQGPETLSTLPDDPQAAPPSLATPPAGPTSAGSQAKHDRDPSEPHIIDRRDPPAREPHDPSVHEPHETPPHEAHEIPHEPSQPEVEVHHMH
jgi:hypothetical protein